MNDVVVIGAGVAGLAASLALADAGVKPLLLERKPYVGGRAYSYKHPALSEIIDSQHVMVGCCTNLIDLCSITGADKHIRWYDRIPFLEPGGHVSVLSAGSSPAASLRFLRAPMLSLADKAGIVRGLMEFVRGFPETDEEAFSVWLKRTKQSERAIRHFWEPVVIATLNDTFDRCSTRYAGQVFHEAFLVSADGGRMGIPTEPLSEFYARAARTAESRGTKLRLRASVERIERKFEGWDLTLSDATGVRAKNIVLALPFEQTRRLLATLPEADEARVRLLAQANHFTHAPITTIHLWFDREITNREQCALLDTRIQWLFNKSLIRRDEPAWRGVGQYLELVISASFAEIEMGREEILASSLRELAMFFPKVNEAKLMKSGVLKEARATFSVLPGLDRYRPGASVGAGLYLAGDWVRTGWPSTMEGGVRSGRLAAEAITGRQALVADLPASGIMKLLTR